MAAATPGWVDTKNYEKYLMLFPRVCTDIVVRSGPTVLLVKRNHNNTAWAGVWATPGGRIYKDERVAHAASRILKRETGISVKGNDLVFRGFEEQVVAKEHGITLIFQTRVRSSVPLAPDETSSEIRWFDVNKLPSLKPQYRNIIYRSLDDRKLIFGIPSRRMGD